MPIAGAVVGATGPVAESVSCGGGRGLLPPDPEGVDTAGRQIGAARQRGGISSKEKYMLKRFKVVWHT